MAEVTWENLARTIVDKTKIADYVAQKIKEHNEDESAHSQELESLYNHRIADVLDHVESAVKGWHLAVAAKLADCIVAPEDGDYTDIQSAIDAGKKSIFVKAGTYEITSPITILNSGVTIIGESWTNAIIKVADGANCDVFQIGDGVNPLSDIVIEDIQIDGNISGQGASPAWNSSGITLESSIAKAIIRDCYIHHLTYNGIFIKDGSEDNTIRNNRVEYCNAYGIWNHSSNYNNIRNNVCNHNGTTTEGGIYLYSSDNCVIIGNKADYNNGNGIRSDGNNNNIIANRANSNANPSGASLVAGIRAGHSDIIVGNQANSNALYGIFAGDDSIVSNNEVGSNGDNGIHIQTSDDVTITGNRCNGNGGYGINIDDAWCGSCLVVGNSARGNTSGGVRDAGTNTEIGHNTE